MRSKIRSIKHYGYGDRRVFRRFAWWPTRVGAGDGWRWVWLEPYEELREAKQFRLGLRTADHVLVWSLVSRRQIGDVSWPAHFPILPERCGPPPRPPPSFANPYASVGAKGPREEGVA